MVVPQRHSLVDFSSRAAAVFGSLDPSGTSSAAQTTQWSLSAEQVFRTGKADDYSSEEEEAKEMERRNREFIPGSMLELEGLGRSHTT